MVIKKNSCSNELSIKFILLVNVKMPTIVKSILLKNVKMPTIVGILTFISRINTISESFKASKILIFLHSSFYNQLKFHAQSS